MFKKIIHSCFRTLEHHPEHTTTVHVLGKDFKCCSRCLSMYVFAVISFFAFGLLHLSGFHYDFWFIFLFSIGLGCLAIADWSSVEIFRLREGSSLARTVTGGALGIGISMYIWLLPSTLLFKGATLLLFNLCFAFVFFLNMCRKHKLHPMKAIDQLIENSGIFSHKRTNCVQCATYPSTCGGCCPCCGCPCGDMGAGCLPLVLCIPCCCGLACLGNSLIGGDGKGGCCGI